jgi:hypothetical protein
VEKAMSTSVGNSALTAPSADSGGDDPRRPATAEVCHTARGMWRVLLPGETEQLTCETLAVAKRIGARWAQDNPPSELIVRDAYHRVVLRKSFGDGERPCRARSR